MVQKSKIEKLREATSNKDLARLLGYKKAKNLTYAMFKSRANDMKISNDPRYFYFEIRKKNGGLRKISAPNKHLKEAQKRLSNLLYECVEEYSEKAKLSPSFGYTKHKSIFDNAIKHRKKNMS